MVKWLALGALLAAAGCFEDRYRCTSDEQCDLGDGGRCEVDGLCTHFDLTCATQRRYSSHAGDLTDQCFDDRIAPKNACAGGQPPSLPDGCFADVCARLPACCDLGWTDTCAQIAQEACTSFTCDTRIAVNAVRGTTSERYLLIWDGSAWNIAPRSELGEPLAWVGPAPGDGAPRLASTAPNELVIADTHFPVEAGRTYATITSIGFDRDRRDTIVATYANANGNFAEIWKLDSQSVREEQVAASAGLAWGDDNRDAFPDAVIKNGGASYFYFDNVEGDNHTRRLLNQATSTVSGGATTGSLQVRSLDWLDLDGDSKLDLVVFGSSLRIHTRPDDLNDAPQLELDCDPPNTDRTCMADPEPDLEATSFGGCALPSAANPGPSVIASIFPDRKLFRIRDVDGKAVVTQMSFPGDTCSCTRIPANNCPGPNCTNSYDCTMCASVLALAARDLDGDHVLDLIAIDARLRLYTALAANGYAFGTATPIVSPPPAPYTAINISVSGAVLP